MCWNRSFLFGPAVMMNRLHVREKTVPPVDRRWSESLRLQAVTGSAPSALRRQWRAPADAIPTPECAASSRPQFLALDSRLPGSSRAALAWPRVAPYPIVRPFVRSGFARLVLRRNVGTIFSVKAMRGQREPVREQQARGDEAGSPGPSRKSPLSRRLNGQRPTRSARVRPITRKTSWVKRL